MGTSHKDPVRDRIGVYYKYKTKDYRSECEGCGKGYHSHRWQAHHILPGMVFMDLVDYIRECLGVTDYNINKPYSMCGLPTLKAFILYFQGDDTFPISKDKTKLVQMKRWGDIRKYKYQAHIEVTFPGDLPCHQPVSFGHVRYNEEVIEHLTQEIWKPLKKKKDKEDHPEPEDIKEKLIKAKDKFWNHLKNKGKGSGGGGHKGIEANLRNRYDSAKNGWWKPMCMCLEDFSSAPTSPSLR